MLLLIVAILVNHSAVLLIECGLKLKKFDLEKLSEHLFGDIGYFTALTVMFLFAYGGQIAYLVIIGDSIPLLSGFIYPNSILENRNISLLLFSTLIILPMCLFKNLSSLTSTSFISILADVILISIVTYAAVYISIKNNDNKKHNYLNLSSNLNYSNFDIFSGIGTMSFAFVCQHNSFIIFKSLKEPCIEKWKKVAFSSVCFSFLLSLFFGLTGF
jgi:sodium-coupled neutral amino acid transporter 11